MLGCDINSFIIIIIVIIIISDQSLGAYLRYSTELRTFLNSLAIKHSEDRAHITF